MSYDIAPASPRLFCSRGNPLRQSSLDRVYREDLLLFINAGLTATGQGGFYHGHEEERLSLDFLHLYIATNYRPIYALTLAVGLNDHNQARVLFTLLSLGAPAQPDERRLEGQLIATALSRLPAHRCYRLWERLAVAGINNRRTRSSLRAFLQQRRDLAFDAIKYRRRFKKALLHGHLKVDPEIKRFLFEGAGKKPYRHGLLETYRKARYDARSIYDLPFTVAEGLAQRKNVPRDEFLANIAPRMTEREKLRYQNAGAAAFDPQRVDLVELCIYFLSLELPERQQLWPQLQQRSQQLAQSWALPQALRQGRVAAVLDNSYSSLGSARARRRPLALALALQLALSHSCADFRAVWTTPVPDLLQLTPRGSTELGQALLNACEPLPQWLLIVSDGRENAPQGACQAILQAWKARLSLPQPVCVHLNPVYDPDQFQPMSLGPDIPVVGLRKLEDVPTALLFADFAQGRIQPDQLRQSLQERAHDFA